MELKKIEKAHAAALPADEHTLELLIGHLCSQLQHFITARIKAIGLYLFDHCSELVPPAIFLNCFIVHNKNGNKCATDVNHKAKK